MPADITGTNILAEGERGAREFRFQPGPHLREPGPGGRDQPGHAEDAVGLAGGDAGSLGDGGE